MKASKLNRAVEKGREDAFAHEDALASSYGQAIAQVGRLAASRFSEVAGAALTAAAPSSRSAMVAVYPTAEQAQELALPNGEPAEILHVTLAFLGELDPDQAEAAAAVVAEVARKFEGPLEGTVGGRAAFGSETGMWAEVARIAGLVRPEGGYGETLWNFPEKAVYWIPADWTTDDESEAAAQAFLSVPGVESVVVLESESATPEGDEWLLLWAGGQALVEASYPSILLPDVPGLAELRQAVTEALGAAGVPYATNHGWQPHCTLDYLPEPDPPPADLLGLPLTFENVSFTQGDVARDFPLGQDALVAAGPPDWHVPHPDEVVDVDEIISKLRTKADPVRQAAIKAATLPALHAAHIDFDATNPFVAAVLDKTGAEVVGIAETTRLNVLRIIRDGYEQGLTVPDTAKAIREGMAAADEGRAKVIARTELNSLAAGGSVAATRIVAEATGIAYWKTWRVAPGAPNPRHEDYEDLDGQTVALDDFFDVGGSKMAYPGDPDGEPAESIMCRCVLTFGERPGIDGEAEDGSDLSETADELAAIEAPKIEGDSAFELAASVVARATAIEPKLTAIMGQVVEPLGGHLEGLSFRLKTEKSMARKIKLVAKEAQIPEKASAHAMKDGVRYTAVYGPRDFASKARSTLDHLRRAGLAPETIRSRWAKGEPYVGLNVILRAPNGVRAELQIHTPESLRAKQVLNHGLYEKWRELEPGTAEAKKIEKGMVTNSDSVARPPGMESWTYEPSVEADIGITPFRTGDDPIGFYDTAKYKRFQGDIEESARAYGVEVQEERRVAGVWEGSEEPAVALRVHDGELGVRAFAANLGRAYEQDGVLLFTGKAGEDVVATFGVGETTREQVFVAMTEAGLPAGRFLEDGRLQVIGAGPDFVKQLDSLAARLRTGYDADVGEFRLLERANGDYETAITDFSGAQGEQVRATERAAEGDRGHAAVRQGAEGGQAGARQVGVPPPPPNVAVAKTFPQPAVPQVPVPLTPAQVKGLAVDALWKKAAELGKINNLARAEIATKAQRPVYESLWKRGEGRPKKGRVRYSDLAGDQQVHSTFSDGHESILQMAREAQARGQRRLVISDHSHLLTAEDIEAQHVQIDLVNAHFRAEGVDFEVAKGIEVNILADGTLDTPLEVLQQFDVVNAAIHAPQAGEQLALFLESNTDRMLKAMDSPAVRVIVHPHSVDANWDLVAKKAAERNVALEVNGRDMLRHDRQDAAAEMIKAAKEHGAKLVIGSDAHTTADLADILYAVRFAAQHGVTLEDILPAQRAFIDPVESLPKQVSLAVKTDGGNVWATDLPNPDVRNLGGGMAHVYRAETPEGTVVVKVPKTNEEINFEFGDGSVMDSGPLTFRMRENVDPGFDIAREKGAYTLSKFFNEAGGKDFHVYTPAVRDATVVQPTGESSGRGDLGVLHYRKTETVAAEIQEFVEGTVAVSDISWLTATSAEDRRSAGLFDAIIGNTDRHAGNFMVGDDGHLWLIDHGLSFPSYADSGQFSNEMLVEHAASAFKANLTPREVSFLERFLSRWDELEAALVEDGVPAGDIAETKARVELMLAENTRRPWPKGRAADPFGLDRAFG